MTKPANLQALYQAITDILATPGQDDYTRLNHLRDWFNGIYGDSYELYLEDVWNDNVPGETHLEYILRIKVTRNETGAFAHDVYLNHQDAKGVWHLDDYQRTHITANIPQVMSEFIQDNE